MFQLCETLIPMVPSSAWLVGFALSSWRLLSQITFFPNKLFIWPCRLFASAVKLGPILLPAPVSLHEWGTLVEWWDQLW